MRGKALSFWARALYSNNPPLITEAKSAIEELGTNAIPYLLYLVQKQDTPVTKAAAWLNAHQPLIRLPITTASQWHDYALSAVKTLQGRVDPFVPEFLRLVDNPESARIGVALLTFCGSN